MKPTYHLFLTAIAFLIINLFLSLRLSALFIALLLTIAVDAVDHSMIVLFIRNKVTNNARKLAFRLRLKEAYKTYYKGRYITRRAFMHNLAFFAVITALGAVYKSPVILLGISFHFVCDMVSDLYFMKRLNDNWTFAYLLKKDG